MKRQENRKDFINLSLRIPKSTYQQIKLVADREDKSRSFYIVEVIKQSLKKETNWKKKQSKMQ